MNSAFHGTHFARTIILMVEKNHITIMSSEKNVFSRAESERRDDPQEVCAYCSETVWRGEFLQNSQHALFSLRSALEFPITRRSRVLGSCSNKSSAMNTQMCIYMSAHGAGPIKGLRE